MSLFDYSGPTLPFTFSFLYYMPNSDDQSSLTRSSSGRTALYSHIGRALNLLLLTLQEDKSLCDRILPGYLLNSLIQSIIVRLLTVVHIFFSLNCSTFLLVSHHLLVLYYIICSFIAFFISVFSSSGPKYSSSTSS